MNSWKCSRVLRVQRHGVEEAVHQEALAAPDAAVHVDAARDRRAADAAWSARCCAAPCSRPTRSRSAPAHRSRAAAPDRPCSRARRASLRRAGGLARARRAQKFSVRLSTASAASLVASLRRRVRVADARDVLGAGLELHRHHRLGDQLRGHTGRRCARPGSRRSSRRRATSPCRSCRPAPRARPLAMNGKVPAL